LEFEQAEGLFIKIQDPRTKIQDPRKKQELKTQIGRRSKTMTRIKTGAQKMQTQKK